MNPEFLRNVAVELTPKRLALMTGGLALILFLSALTGQASLAPGEAARWAYYAIVVVWGTRNAALAVAGEIRDRTWDTQRLSALGAGSMTLGKLFGATLYNWFGGAICLLVLWGYFAGRWGPEIASGEVAYFIAAGVIAHAASLLVSLIATVRGSRHTQGELLLYQAVGIAAAGAVYAVWQGAAPGGAMELPRTMTWWGQVYDMRGFLLSSFVSAALWLALGCYGWMRAELRVRNPPFVWIAFLVFLTAYAAGLGWELSAMPALAPFPLPVRGLVLAGAVLAALAYAVALLEPKGRALPWRRFDRVLQEMPRRVWCCAAIVFVAGALLNQLGGAPAAQGLVVAALGFLARDMALIQVLGKAARPWGDLAAVGAFFVLYGLLPAIVNGLGLTSALTAFYPYTDGTIWLAPAAAWVEAAAAVSLVVGPRFRPKPAESGA